MKQYLLTILLLASSIEVFAQEPAPLKPVKPKLGVLVTAHVGGAAQKRQAQAMVGAPNNRWEHQTNLNLNLTAMKSVATNFFIGAGLGYTANKIKSAPSNGLIACNNCGYQGWIIKNDYEINQRTIAPMFVMEYLFPLTPKLSLGIYSFDRLEFTKSNSSFSTELYKGGVGDGSSTGDQWGQPGGTPAGVTRGASESRYAALHSGLVTSLRWTFSKYVGVQLSTGGLFITKELKGSSFAADTKEGAWTFEANFEPRNWMLGVYTHF